jgi:7-cyano-7-deazaguanine synthase in queuosine biosynthesis
MISDSDFRYGGANGPQIESMAEPGDQMPAWAWDLLQVARAAYVADKKSKREEAVDGWTRDIRIHVPVRAPDRWDEPTSTLLRGLLQTLTADRWNVTFQPGSSAWGRQGRVIHNWTADEVSLFSGGLDSTAFAADLARHQGKSVLLVMFFDPPTKTQQEAILEDIRSIHSNRNLHLRSASQMVVGSLERSSRSRGLLYIATAVYMAAAHGASRVHLPENGQLALNLPLTPGRLAACSTRSVHPRTLDLLNQLITALGGNVTVTNPLGRRTKGEVCDLAVEAGLTRETLCATISCGHPPRKRKPGYPFHCGYCYPCLVRRAGLHHALGTDNSGYQHDPWHLPSTDTKTEDLLALQIWLSNPLTNMDLIADTPLPAGTNSVDLMPAQRRARRELTAFLDAVLPENGPYRDSWRPSL